MSTIEELYQTSQKESSPEKLDNYLLATAKQSCETIVVRKKSKLLYALPTAAVVLMGLSLIINIQNESSSIQTAPSFKIETINTIKNQSSKQSWDAMKLKRTETDELLPAIGESITEMKNDAIFYSQQVPQKPRSISQKPLKIRLTPPQEGFSLDDKVLGSLKQEKPYKISKSDETTNLTIVRKKSLNSSIGRIVPNIETIETAKKANISLETSDLATSTSVLSAYQEQRNSLQIQLIELENLINESKFSQANKTLESLKIQYPDFDFTTIENKITNH